jgi:hypothetical protein
MLIGEEIGIVEEFSSFLRDGVVLCKLVNQIVPGLIPRINQVPEIPHTNNKIGLNTSSIKSKVYRFIRGY